MTKLNERESALGLVDENMFGIQKFHSQNDVYMHHHVSNVCAWHKKDIIICIINLCEK